MGVQPEKAKKGNFEKGTYVTGVRTCPKSIKEQKKGR